MEDDDLKESGAAVIVVLAGAISGFIVSAIAFGSFWVLTSP